MISLDPLFVKSTVQLILEDRFALALHILSTGKRLRSRELL